MAGTREINSDLEVKGTVNIMTVPDATGNFLTWAPGGGVSRRVPSDVRLDIGAEAAANKVQNFLSPDNTTYPTTQAVVNYVTSQIPAAQTLSQPSLGQLAISGGNTVNLNTVNTSGNQTGIAGNKTWTGTQTFSALSGVGNGLAGLNASGQLTRRELGDLGFVPYTGATQGVDLNTQNVDIGGNFTKNPTTLELFKYNAATTTVGFRRYSNVANNAAANVTTPTDIIVRLPELSVSTASGWVAKLILFSAGGGGHLSSPVYLNIFSRGRSNLGSTVSAIGGVDFISEVKFGAIDNSPVLVIKRTTQNSNAYLRVAVLDYFSTVNPQPAEEIKSNYSVTFENESDLVGFTLHGVVTNAQFTRDSYYLDYNNLANKPAIPAAQVNSDWNATSGVAEILNKPAIGDGTLTLATGTGLQGSASFTANQSGNATFTVEAASGYAIPTTAKQNQWDEAYSRGSFREFGLGHTPANNPNFADMDSIWNTVTRLFTETSSPANWPTAEFGSYPMGISFVRSSSVKSQLAIGYGANANLAFRVNNSNGGAWRKVWDDINFNPNTKQDTLVSGTTIKTINGTSILGSGNIVTPNDNTTYTAGSGITLTGTEFSVPVSVTGTGSYVQTVTQTASGIAVTLGTPPNTTYSLMSAAELNTGTATTARSISAERLNTWLNSKNFLTSVSWSDVTDKPTTFTPSAHTHNASDINAGTLGIARIPTGTTGSTVALGNHTHTFASITSKPNTLAGYGITDAYTKSEVDGLIPDTDNFVTLDGAQTISGEKTLTNTLNIGDGSSIVFSESDPLRRSVIQRSEAWPYGIDIIIPGGTSANQAMFTLRRRVASSELLVDILQIDGQTGNAYFSGLNFGVANSLTTNNFTSEGQSTVAYLTVTGELGLPGTSNQVVRGDGSIGALPAQSMAMNDLTDVTTTTPLHGDLLSWNGSINQWVNVSQSSLPAFSTYVSGQVPAPGAGTNTRVLQANGQWVEPSGGGITALTGDVVASGVGSVAATIANNAVTTAKIGSNAVTLNKLTTIPQNQFIGRYSAGTGEAQLLTLGAGFSVNPSTGVVTVDGGGGSVDLVTAGSSSVGAIRYAGSTRTNGQFYGGTSEPNNTTRLNYNGIFHAYDISSYGVSDERQKDNINKITNAIDKVKLLKGVKFKWADDSLYDGIDYGLIAQDVEKILPEIVIERNGVKAIKNGNQINALLVEAVKELNSRIDKLEELINGLSK